MQLPPVEVMMAWPQGNSAHPAEIRGPAILVLTFVCIPLICILVAVRIYTRLRLTKSFGADDIAMVAALFPTLGCAVMTILAVMYHGWDRHVWDIPPEELEMALKFALAVEILFSMGCTLIRLSILLVITRVLAAGSGGLRKLALALIGLMCAEQFVFLVVAINTCSPVSDYWTLSFTPQRCINEGAHVLTAGIINTISDFCVVMIPIPVVLRLRLPLRQRIVCAVLFGAGFIVVIAAGFRISYMHELNTSYDKTWLAYPAWICGTVELYLGIIAASIPAIKPLVTKHFPNLLGTITRHGHSGSLDTYVSFDAKLHSVSQRKNRRAMQPVLSSFSTYNKDNEEALGSLEMEQTPINSMAEEASTSKTSLISFNSRWSPKPLANPAAVRHVENRDVVVRKWDRNDMV